jgi:uncharacterized protein
VEYYVLQELSSRQGNPARLSCGDNLPGQIKSLAESAGADTGVFCAVGTLEMAELAYYDQSSRECSMVPVEGGPVELASCSSNVSIRDGEPFVHCHAVLAGSGVRTPGGHLA